MRLVLASLTVNIKHSDEDLAEIAMTALARALPNTGKIFENDALRDIIMNCLFTAAELREDT